MTPRFKIGDRVETKDKSTCFEIDEIVIRKDEAFYANTYEGYFYPEDNLELVKEPEKIVIVKVKHPDGKIEEYEKGSEDGTFYTDRNWKIIQEYEISVKEIV